MSTFMTIHTSMHMSTFMTIHTSIHMSIHASASAHTHLHTCLCGIFKHSPLLDQSMRYTDHVVMAYVRMTYVFMAYIVMAQYAYGPR